MKKINLTSKRGFTLIELLVVIGILAVLAAIAIPSVAGLIDRANVSADKTNSNEMTNSIERFTSEYEVYCQDIAAGKIKNTANLDGAQARVYNITKATTRSDIEKLESKEGFNGRAIDEDTKYPTNVETARAIMQIYEKTSSSTFEPKQSDCHYYYSPDCGVVVYSEIDSEVETLNSLIVSGKDAKGNNLSTSTQWINITTGKELEAKEETPETKNITFTIRTLDGETTYTTKEGNTWPTWIFETSNGSSTGNGILWIGLDGNTIYLDVNYPNHSIARPTKDDILYLYENDNATTKQTTNSKIIDGAVYSVITQCCFDAGSQVLMADGTTKNIEDVAVGDTVMSLNEDTGEFIMQKVKNTITKHNSDDLVYVNLSDGTQIGMRAYHPLLTTDGWKSLRPELLETIVEIKNAELLKVGDELVGYSGNVTIVSVENRPHIENYNTYNLSIEGYHNYIVNGIVVHNAGCPT